MSLITQSYISDVVADLVSEYLEAHGDTEDTRDEVDDAVRYGVEDAFIDADTQRQWNEESEGMAE